MEDRGRSSFGLPIAVAIALLALAAGAAGVLLSQELTRSGGAAATGLPSRAVVPATNTPSPSWSPGASATPAPGWTPSPSPTPWLVTLPRLSPKVPYAKMSYYPVSGSTPADLGAAMGRNAPAADEEPGTETLAVAELSWRYSVRTSSASGACRIRSVSVSATYKVTLPRWTQPARVRPELLAWWKAVLEELRSHEERHVRIYRKWVAEFREHVVGMRCGSAGAYFRRIEAKMDAEGEAFDAQHGSIDWPPYPGDWDD